jgi:hypothetical protein
MVRDDKRRETMQRVDDSKRQGLVERARHFIYRLGKVVRSTMVEGLLATQSLVPTAVHPNANYSIAR